MHMAVVTGGLIRTVVESWDPQSHQEAAILLEDDIEVSPFFFKWVAHVLHTNRRHFEEGHAMGVSLYTPRLIETVNPRRKVNFFEETPGTGNSNNNMMQYQIPCSWGALYTAPHWIKYRRFMSYRLHHNDSIYVPKSTSIGWEQSWKKYMIEYMWINNVGMIYPNFFNQTSFSTNHLEPGTHIKKSEKSHLPEDFTVPLFTKWPANMVYAASHATFFNVYGNQIVPWHRLSETQTSCQDTRRTMAERICDWTSFNMFMYHERLDKITVLLSAFDWSRAKIIDRLFKVFVESTIVDKILVTWHSQKDCPPPDARIGNIPVYFLISEKDSLNYRFTPDLRIRTSSVLIIDDDILLSPGDLRNLFNVWRMNRKRLVGFFPRWTKDVEGVQYRYESEDGSLGGYRIMLTKAMMMSKEYLYHYFCGVGKKYHAYVEEHMSGEDIAMNFVVNELTGQENALLYLQPRVKLADFGKFLESGLKQKNNRHRHSLSLALETFKEWSGISLKRANQIAVVQPDGKISIIMQDYKGIDHHHHVDCNITDRFIPCEY